MKKITRIILVFLVVISLKPVTAATGPKVKLVAIFADKVIARIDGKRAILVKDKPGPKGVTLRFTDTRAESAEIEINGKVETMPLGFVMSKTTEQSTGITKESVTLRADADGFFHTQGYINGRPVTFLVDTGANTVALNSATANSIGIDYRKGQKGIAVTASGYAQTYGIVLAKVEVGGLELRNVEAGVIEGPQPDPPLLGMSFLSRFNMQREGTRMKLIER